MQEIIKKRTVSTSLINGHGSTYILIPKKLAELYNLNACKHINLAFANDQFSVKPIKEEKQ